ncbi:hypothetical protein JCM10369A_14480 [Nocardioides pyridinolyticus]
MEVREVSAGPALDLTTEQVRRTAVTFAAAEAAGVARWCLATAVEYAQVREQFGRKIGSFQAIKHLCAEMLETAGAVTAAAWDVASVAPSPISGIHEQWAFAADVAAAERLTAAAVSGVRRRVELDLEGRDAAVRPTVAAMVARIAALVEGEHRRALVEAGYLAPHWPAPYGLGADAVTQIVIDQELARAGVTRPDLVIAGWALPTILEHGTDEQRERFVKPSLLGELVWCQLFSEPGHAGQRARGDGVEPARPQHGARDRAGGRARGGGGPGRPAGAGRPRRRAVDGLRPARGAVDAAVARGPRPGSRVQRGQAARRTGPAGRRRAGGVAARRPDPRRR